MNQFSRADFKNCQIKYPKLKNNLTHIDIDYQYCNICLEITFEENNKIVYCEVCDCAAHQDCYGCDLPDFQSNFTSSIFLVQDDWVCSRCNFLLSSVDTLQFDQLPQCILCSQSYSALIQAELNHQAESTLQWCHVSCLKWNKNVTRINLSNKYICNDDYLNKDDSILCCYCHHSFGSLLRCSLLECDKSFHVGCAISNGLIIHRKGMESAEKLMFGNLLSADSVFCLEHYFDKLDGQLIEAQKTKKKDMVDQFYQTFLKVSGYRLQSFYMHNNQLSNQKQLQLLINKIATYKKQPEKAVSTFSDSKQIRTKKLKQQKTMSQKQELLDAEFVEGVKSLKYSQKDRKIKQQFDEFISNKLAELLKVKVKLFKENNTQLVVEGQISRFDEDEYIEIDNQICQLLFGEMGLKIKNLEAFDTFFVQYIFINDLATGQGTDLRVRLNNKKTNIWTKIASKLGISDGDPLQQFISRIRSTKLKVINPKIEKLRQSDKMTQIFNTKAVEVIEDE